MEEQPIYYGLLYLLFLGQRLFSWKGIITATLIVLSISGISYKFSPLFNSRLNKVTLNFHQYHRGKTDTDLGYRLKQFKNSWTLVKRHPIIGTGTGSFKTEYATLPKEAITGSIFVATNIPPTSECTYMNILVQYGFVGLAGLILMFFYFWQHTKRLPKDEACIIQFFMLTYLIAGIATALLSSSYATHLLSILLALSYSLLATQTSRNPEAIKHES